MGQINTKFIDNITSQINNLSDKVSVTIDCTALKELEDQFLAYKASIEAYFDDLKADLQKRIDALAALIINPTDLGKVISWINTFIATNITGPYVSMLALQADILIKLAEIQNSLNNLQDSIENKSLELGCTIEEEV